MIQELDADGLTGVCREIKGHLNPDLVIGRVLEELLHDLAIAINHISFLPAVGAGVIAGWPVVEAEGSMLCASWNGYRLIGSRIALLPTAKSHL